MSNTRKLYPIAFLALVISIGSLFYAATPCSIAGAQTICDVGDIETISDSLIIQNELQVGSTPTAGSAGQALISGGTGNSPIWGAPALGENIYYLPNDVSKSTTSLSDSDALSTGNISGDIVHFSVMMRVNSPAAGDFKFELDANSDVSAECNGFTHDQDTFNLVEITACDTPYVVETTGSDSFLWMEFTVNEIPASGITLKWAQNVVSGSVTMEEGSFIAWREIN